MSLISKTPTEILHLNFCECNQCYLYYCGCIYSLSWLEFKSYTQTFESRVFIYADMSSPCLFLGEENTSYCKHAYMYV